MKIDIEGSELELVPDLVLSGALRNVSKVFIEWHERNVKDRQRQNLLKTVSCPKDG